MANPDPRQPIGLRRAPEARVARSELPAGVDVAVVGGGLIGLSAAWMLARQGRSVAVIERETLGAGASLAATGMLAPAAEHEPGSDLLLPLALHSLRRWPAFRDALQAASGVPIDYREDGTLVIAIGRDEVERLRFRHDLQRRSGVASEWLSGIEVRRREPALRPNVAAGIHCPLDHQVDPRHVMTALAKACEAAGVALVERCAVEALDWTSGRVTGLHTAAGTLAAGTVILAAGAWSGERGLLPETLSLPVRPLKGQSLALRTSKATGTLAQMIWSEQVHMAPKSDGRIIVGATVEDCGFRPGVTAGGLYALLEGARRVLPGIEEMEVEAVWSGYRPTSDDDAPILDALAPGLVAATGHHRNGYLLAPATAEAVAAFVTTGAWPDYAAGFGRARFRPAESLRASA
ncbi:MULTISPECIES: glycine oxidase ThiO [Methylobacterium]|uniref:Glycine oxidase n=2 Tax=Pseudomonadota TaxID=1224 RepID=A0ABQ4SVI7_9HYPH|nr:MULTISPECIES: glycine oxidase ThiO [Methylobacterium]PIU08773.1 MAG: glycine oxidase ThiO [Methylobacterium sp. CG09_land_8_20_14_0_10_71_15]PIU11898.1 MAG: glycine oxidase ThiO [Methylobacterium sp. CG08_land_8_20_14_0_20_71_15]GBU16077.1 glycine oxidase ThiO [Methylobacterium sp.]GJE07202.1 Glycine oxidase [Methylobacterium jeotgali]